MILEMLMPFSPVHILASGIALQQFYNVVNAQGSSSILTAVPAQYVNVSAVLIRDNLAVIPADWISPNLSKLGLIPNDQLVRTRLTNSFSNAVL